MIADSPVTLSARPPTDVERDALLLAAGTLPRPGGPGGFRGIAALWARDRDLLVGQGVVLELRRRAPGRDQLAPAGWDGAVGLIEMLCVRPEYREAGLEERIVRALARRFRAAVPCRDAILWVGEARVPMLLSTLDALGPVTVDRWLR